MKEIIELLKEQNKLLQSIVSELKRQKEPIELTIDSKKVNR